MTMSDAARSQAPGAAMLEVEDLTVRYGGVVAVRDVSLSVQPGQVLALLGANGAGKTSTLRAITGLEPVASGRVLVDGAPVPRGEANRLQRIIGYVDQNVFLLDGTIAENVAYGEDAVRIDRDRVTLALAKAQLWDYVQALPHGIDSRIGEDGRSLSGGQKQAIGLARVLIRQPRILFLDEPTAHFDVRSEAEFLQRLKGLAKEGMTIVVSTHRPSLLSLVDRILVFDNGKIVADGPAAQILTLLRGPAAAPPQARPANAV